mmetsp:Transcript_10557/g.16119  ORF Transcript_10557/g.16119 Transcript_10557/m.16119 type:complete len:223 (-) Transcript_10557:58-726(-)
MKLANTIITFSLLPALALATCVEMTDVPKSYRENELTNCDSTSACTCRMFAGWLQCDLGNHLASIPRICTLEELTRESDCMEVQDFANLDLENDCALPDVEDDYQGKCPGKCRVFPPLFASCDLGDDFAGYRGFPLLCEVIGREGDLNGGGNSDDLPCKTLSDVPQAITNIITTCWNTPDYCSSGTCRVLGTPGSEFFQCDQKDSFKGIFHPLCSEGQIITP